jgi:arylformamidase
MQNAIFKTYDQSALDAQYNNRARVVDYMDYLTKWRDMSAQTRATRKARLNVSYGPSDKQTLDIFFAESPSAAVNLFIHGGYWQSFDKDDFSFVAEGMIPHDVTTVVLNYDLCPHVTMADIVEQNRLAIAYLWRHAEELQINPARIYVSGHSAGGHLVAMLLATDWPALDLALPKDLLRGGCAISGLFDLKPIQMSYLNNVLRMDDQMAHSTSPIHQTYPVDAHLIIALGGDESPEYHWQAEHFSAFWSGLGYSKVDYVAVGRNHFSIVDELADPGSPLVRQQIDAIASL